MRFREIISEAFTGDLYHGTSVLNAASILASGRMDASAAHGDAPGVSFTRSQKIARDFASLSEERELAAIETNDGISVKGRKARGAILVFDGDAMRRELDATLAPYAWDGDEEEEEERLHDPQGLPNVARFLKAVLVEPHDIAWWVEMVSRAPETYRREFAPTVASLAQHPKVRASLTEGKVYRVDVGLTKPLPILSNPTVQQAARLMREVKERSGGQHFYLRGLMIEDSEVLIWDAYSATHDEIREKLFPDIPRYSSDLSTFEVNERGLINIQPGDYDLLGNRFVMSIKHAVESLR